MMQIEYDLRFEQLSFKFILDKDEHDLGFQLLGWRWALTRIQ